MLLSLIMLLPLQTSFEHISLSRNNIAAELQTFPTKQVLTIGPVSSLGPIELTEVILRLFLAIQVHRFLGAQVQRIIPLR